MLNYKLTNKENQTYNKTQWGEGISHETTGEGDLCGPGWLHYYNSPLLAILLNSIHADFKEYNLWECEVGGKIKEDRGLKFGCTKLTTIRQINIPSITNTQKVAFSILCAKEVCKDEKWNLWADNWLNGKDRSNTAAYTAVYASANYAAAATATYATYYAAANAANYNTTKRYLIKLAEECMKY